MAFGMSYQKEEDPAPAASTDMASELARVKAQLDEQQNQFQALRNHNLQATTTANQQIDLLRGQLAEQMGSRSATPPAQAAPTDDWMSFLSGGVAGTPAPTSPAQGGLSVEQARAVYRAEQARDQNAMAQEHQKVAELNARFVVEHPDLAKNPLAIVAIKNGFQAVSNLRPDLSAEIRYKMAIDNATKELLPALQQHIPAPAPEAKARTQKEKPVASSPYMSNLFQAAPGTKSLADQLGAVSGESLEDKFAKREKELEDYRKNMRKLQGR